MDYQAGKYVNPMDNVVSLIHGDELFYGVLAQTDEIMDVLEIMGLTVNSPGQEINISMEKVGKFNHVFEIGINETLLPIHDSL
jgi:hypothetical protein